MSDPLRQAPAILYVDDEANALKYFQRAISPLAPVITAESVEEGKRLLDLHADSLMVLVSDQRMPGANGNELLYYAWDRYPQMVRILTTAYSELEHTIDAVNQGKIHRYLQKPWDISALRMELRQALELARLRQDHGLLLREKLLIRQQQAVANRIAMLYSLCAGLVMEAPMVAVEASLAAAVSAGLNPPEPDWLLMNYSELVSAEAFRSAGLATQMRSHLARLEQRCPGSECEQVLLLLAEQFGNAFRATGPDSGVFLNLQVLTEFLEAPVERPVSSGHAFWMACLLWLSKRGKSLDMTGVADGVECTLVAADTEHSMEQLAAWIEQF
ncbi:response regulator [Oxalobacteraceae bacterium]|nr:response regulator [Oxalobacteraceae bacterium]